MNRTKQTDQDTSIKQRKIAPQTLLKALLHHYTDTSDNSYVYADDGVMLCTVEEAKTVVCPKEIANDDQTALESCIDTALNEFGTCFPDIPHKDISPLLRWWKTLQDKLSDRYENL